VGEGLCTEVARLVLDNEFQEMKRLGPWIEEVLGRSALGPATSFAVQVCLDEAVANVIRHGKAAAKASRIVVTLKRRDDECILRIDDDGAAFDPTLAAPRVRPVSWESAEIGGLGVHLMRTFSARMRYERVAEQNRLWLYFPVAA
jgi:anti-sigma regulatory factor (Ser/Thr protein kinase)